MQASLTSQKPRDGEDDFTTSHIREAAAVLHPSCTPVLANGILQLLALKGDVCFLLSDTCISQ